VSGQGVVLFFSIHAVFELEKSLKAKGIETKPIRTPRHLSSDCGTALQFPLPRREDVEATIAQTEIEIEAIHELHP
jgi:hypothetical protein